MARHVLAFDLDGTLVKHVGDVLFDNSASLAQGCIVDRAAKKRVVELLDQGHEVHVVTARSRKVRLVTKAQVASVDARLKLLIKQHEAPDEDPAKGESGEKHRAGERVPAESRNAGHCPYLSGCSA